MRIADKLSAMPISPTGKLGTNTYFPRMFFDESIIKDTLKKAEKRITDNPHLSNESKIDELAKLQFRLKRLDGDYNFDDMVDTAGTLTKSATLFMEHGAKSVRAFCTHAVLSGPAYNRIDESVLKELVVTNTIPLKKESSKIKVVSVAEMFGDVMQKHISFESISDHFVFANQ